MKRSGLWPRVQADSIKSKDSQLYKSGNDLLALNLQQGILRHNISIELGDTPAYLISQLNSACNPGVIIFIIIRHTTLLRLNNLLLEKIHFEV